MSSSSSASSLPAPRLVDVVDLASRIVDNLRSPSPAAPSVDVGFDIISHNTNNNNQKIPTLSTSGSSRSFSGFHADFDVELGLFRIARGDKGDNHKGSSTLSLLLMYITLH